MENMTALWDVEYKFYPLESSIIFSSCSLIVFVFSFDNEFADDVWNLELSMKLTLSNL